MVNQTLLTGLQFPHHETIMDWMCFMVLSHLNSLWFPRARRGKKEEERVDVGYFIFLFHYLSWEVWTDRVSQPLKAMFCTPEQGIPRREEDFSHMSI